MVKKLVLCAALIGGLYANNAHAGVDAKVAKSATTVAPATLKLPAAPIAVAPLPAKTR